MNLFDHDGSVVSAPITESVQIRVFRNVPTKYGPRPWDERTEPAALQDVYEFKLDRVTLFAGKSGGLRAVTGDEQEFPASDLTASTSKDR